MTPIDPSRNQVASYPERSKSTEFSLQQANDLRKQGELAAMARYRCKTAAAWSQSDAEARSQQDVDLFRAELDPTEKAYKFDDIALKAGANRYYANALLTQAPDVFAGLPVFPPNGVIEQLASDLSSIALGEMFSEKVIHAAVDRLNAMRDVSYPDGTIHI